MAIIYVILGYWAVGQTIYADKVRFGTLQGLFLSRLALAVFLGWVLIPIALVKMIFS